MATSLVRLGVLAALFCSLRCLWFAAEDGRHGLSLLAGCSTLHSRSDCIVARQGYHWIPLLEVPNYTRLPIITSYLFHQTPNPHTKTHQVVPSTHEVREVCIIVASCKPTTAATQLRTSSSYIKMLIPIAAGIAAAVSKAIPSLKLGVTDRYLMDVDAHAKELMERGGSFINGVLDRDGAIFDIANVVDKVAARQDTKRVKASVKKRPPSLPTTDEPLTLLGLNAMHPPKDFDEVKAAYKRTVKLYHPDLLGPDATEKEKADASNDFRRINEAFEMLKKRHDGSDSSNDEVVDNNRRTRDSTSQRAYDPYQVNFEQLRQNARNYQRRRMWYEDEVYYGAQIESHQSQRERWWQQQENEYVYEYDDVTHNRGYGTPGDFARQSFQYGYQQGFYNTNRAYSNNQYQVNSQIFDGSGYVRRDGFHKERAWFYDQFDDARYDEVPYDYYQSREGYDRFRDKWWTKGHDEYDSRLNGDFGP